MFLNLYRLFSPFLHSAENLELYPATKIQQKFVLEEKQWKRKKLILFLITGFATMHTWNSHQAPWLDGRSVAFGYIANSESYEALETLEAIGNEYGKPSVLVQVMRISSPG